MGYRDNWTNKTEEGGGVWGGAGGGRRGGAESGGEEGGRGGRGKRKGRENLKECRQNGLLGCEFKN